MSRRVGTFASLILVTVLATAAQVKDGTDAPHSEGTFEEMCKAIKCAPASTIHIKMSDGKDLSVPAPAHPRVYKGEIRIMLGETVYVEAEEKEGTLTNLRAVDEVTNPSQTLVFESFQKELGSGEIHTFLGVHNPFSHYLRYRARISRLGQGFSATSTCPVPSAKMSIETWPEPVVQTLITDFQLFEPREGEKLECR